MLFVPRFGVSFVERERSSVSGILGIVAAAFSDHDVTTCNTFRKS